MATASNTTTYGDIGQRTALYAAREMLKHAEPVLILSKMGVTKPLPKNTAQTMKFRRPKPFPVSTVPLQEGVTPTPQKIQYEDVVVTIRQYGAVTEISDVVLDTSEDAVLNDNVMLMGEQAGATVEQIVYNAVKGGTNVYYANGASRSAVNTPVSGNKLRAVARGLSAQKAKPITRMLSGSPDYATSPVEGGWVVVGHTDLDSDIRNLTGFIPTAKYGTKQLISEREIGSWETFRFVLTPDLAPFADAGGAAGSMLSTTGTNADVYPMLIFGQDAFAHVPLKGMNAMTPTVVNPKPSAADPLGQRGYVGFKFYYAALILNELWMARLEVAATKL